MATKSLKKSTETVLLLDVGSTTTKAHFIEEGKLITQYVPTTVEKPYEDVMVGVNKAVKKLEKNFKEKSLSNSLTLATSSAGGGLQMLVTGLVRRITAKSAERAALSSGAIIIDILAVDDGKTSHEKVEMIKHARPDIILMAGGEDGGAVSGMARIAELIKVANPQGKWVKKIPLVYAGNIDARNYIKETLEPIMDVYFTPNVRPKMDVENPVPARNLIHELFMEHVMARAPGYHGLTQIVDAPILPTPAAAFRMVKRIAENWGVNVIAVDVGGATTDVFSVIDDKANRTVSANLGMSYSMGNVLYSSGIKNLMNWLPQEFKIEWVKDKIMNKVLNPITLPETSVDMLLEGAVAREAIKLALQYHRDFIRTQAKKYALTPFGTRVEQRARGQPASDSLGVNLILGSGGALSYTPRENALSILIDGFKPMGITEIGVDSKFLLPHLGVLDTVNHELAWELFKKICYLPLATCIIPTGKIKKGRRALILDGAMEIMGGETRELVLEGKHKIAPIRNLDIGVGRGKQIIYDFHGKVIIDAGGLYGAH